MLTECAALSLLGIANKGEKKITYFQVQKAALGDHSGSALNSAE